MSCGLVERFTTESQRAQRLFPILFVSVVNFFYDDRIFRHAAPTPDREGRIGVSPYLRAGGGTWGLSYKQNLACETGDRAYRL